MQGNLYWRYLNQIPGACPVDIALPSQSTDTLNNNPAAFALPGWHQREPYPQPLAISTAAKESPE